MSEIITEKKWLTGNRPVLYLEYKLLLDEHRSQTGLVPWQGYELALQDGRIPLDIPSRGVHLVTTTVSSQTLHRVACMDAYTTDDRAILPS